MRKDCGAQSQGHPNREARPKRNRPHKQNLWKPLPGRPVDARKKNRISTGRRGKSRAMSEVEGTQAKPVVGGDVQSGDSGGGGPTTRTDGQRANHAPIPKLPRTVQRKPVRKKKTLVYLDKRKASTVNPEKNDPCQSAQAPMGGLGWGGKINRPQQDHLRCPLEELRTKTPQNQGGRVVATVANPGHTGGSKPSNYLDGPVGKPQDHVNIHQQGALKRVLGELPTRLPQGS